MNEFSGLPPFKSAAAILSHPQFAEARRLHCRIHLDLYRDVTFNRVQMSVARNVLFAVTLCQYAGHDPDDRASWPTLGRLQDIVQGLQVGSRRMVDDFVSRLKAVGYLMEVPAPGDKRVKLLKPTESMLAHDRRYCAALIAPLMTLFPSPDYRPAIELDPVFHMAQRQVGLSLMSNARSIMAGHPVLMGLFNRDAGYGVTIWLIEAAMSAGGGSTPISLTEVGERFSVSRTHVRAVLRELEGAGFVSVTGRGAQKSVEVLPPLLQSLDAFLAEVLSAQDIITQIVLANGYQYVGMASPKVAAAG